VKTVKIVERIETIMSLDAPPRRLRDAIEQQLSEHFGFPALQAAEWAERLETPVAGLIEARQIECDSNGTIAVVALIGSAANIVVGSCYALPTDEPAIARVKANRINAAPLLARMQSLTSSEFELFGAKILRELGAQKVHVTPQSNDQGIDFYGTLNFGQFVNAPRSFFRLTHDFEIRFAGQAKHYPNNPVGTNAIRELVGAISLARFKAFSMEEDMFEELELKALNPLLALLFTTGRLTAGAVELANKVGIIARSGIQLAVFLADRGVGMMPSGMSVVFEPSAFDRWLNAS
jgi:hypothetical protein